MMNKELLETEWVHAKELLRERWGKLTEEDLKEIEGRFDLLVNKLEQRYGYSKEKAEEEVRRWNFEKAEEGTEKSTYTSAERPQKPYLNPENQSFREKEDSPSSFKWLIGIAIPLLLIALYFSMTSTPETNPIPYAAYEDITVYVENPADQPLGQAIHQTLKDNSSQFTDLKTVRVSTSNGIVTVSGTVPSAQERDTLLNFLSRINGVKQVNNQLTIKS